jgi:hypothetical protein
MVCLERQTLTTALMLGVCSAWLGFGFADPPRTATTDRADRARSDIIRLRVSVSPGIDAATVRLAKTIATELLKSAHIESEWQDEDTPGRGRGRRVLAVDVLLLPHRKATQADVSGEVAHDVRTRAPMVLVYMPRIADLVRAIRVSPAGRSNPALATTDLGHLGGLTIAHEVGHILGLPHAPSGVMKARPGIDEVLKLRASQLRFLPADAARMRQTVVALARLPSL